MLSQKESCLQWGGIRQFFDLWEANPGPLGQGVGQIRSLCSSFGSALRPWPVQRKATWLSVENQTKEQRHTHLLVSVHHDDGWILFCKVKVSNPYIKTIYLSVQKIMSKVFLHLLMTGIGEKEDGLKFCHCQLWLSLNTLSTVVITQLFIAPAQKGAEGPEQLSPAVEIPLAHLSKDSCLVCSSLNRHHPLPTCL